MYDMMFYYVFHMASQISHCILMISRVKAAKRWGSTCATVLLLFPSQMTPGCACIKKMTTGAGYLNALCHESVQTPPMQYSGLQKTTGQCRLR